MLKTEKDVVIAQRQIWDFDFERELACQKNWTWHEVDELVKKYKFDRLTDEEREELELEIFRANFYWLYDIAKKNTYVIQGYNTDDMYSCMFFAHRNLLDSFKIVRFETDREEIKKSKSQISFRYYLKQYFASRFHRYFIEGTKDFKGNDLNENRAKGVSAVSYDKEEFYQMCDDRFEQDINKIEISDMNIKEEIKKEVRRVLERDEADCLLIYFDLLKRNKATAHLKKHQISRVAKECIYKLKWNERLKELFDYYLTHVKG